MGYYNARLNRKIMCIQKIKIGIFSAYKYGEKSLSYTITEKGTVTIPAEVKKIRVEKRLQGQVRGDRGRDPDCPRNPVGGAFRRGQER